MKFDYRRGWQVDEAATPGSFDFKTPYLDNGVGRISPKRYFDPSYAALEAKNLWPKTWLLAGLECDAPKSGDYFTYDIGIESFIIIRTDDNRLRAHYNVCPHRGSRLVFESLGFVNKFSCPFHGWTFKRDGRLDEVRDRDTFREEVLCGTSNLTSVRCEVVAGIVFITMDNDAPSARDWLGKLAEFLDQYDIPNMRVITHKRSEWKANWKTGVDAFGELYHLATVHPQTAGFMEDYQPQLDLYPNGHSRHILKFAQPSARSQDQESVNLGIRLMLRDAGINPDTYTGNARTARSDIQKAKRARAIKFGLDYSKFTDSQLSDSIGLHIFPNIMMGLHPEGVYLMRFMPHESDPNQFCYETIILFAFVDDPDYRFPIWAGLPDDVDLNPGERPEITNVPVGTDPQLGEVLSQDANLLPWVQRGVRSRSFRGPVWSEQEIRLRHYHKEIDRYIEGDR